MDQLTFLLLHYHLSKLLKFLHRIKHILGRIPLQSPPTVGFGHYNSPRFKKSMHFMILQVALSSCSSSSPSNRDSHPSSILAFWVKSPNKRRHLKSEGSSMKMLLGITIKWMVSGVFIIFLRSLSSSWYSRDPQKMAHNPAALIPKPQLRLVCWWLVNLPHP